MITLVLGGARSGKSAVAELLVRAGGDDVVYLATAEVPEDDDDFADRVEAHRARRPPSWTTVECEHDVVGALRAHPGRPALIDSLGTWLAWWEHFEPDVDSLLDAIRTHGADVVVVSEEVGLGVHPETAVGRRWRDALGDLNQAVAAIADRAVLVVAGRIVEL